MRKKQDTHRVLTTNRDIFLPFCNTQTIIQYKAKKSSLNHYFFFCFCFVFAITFFSRFLSAPNTATRTRHLPSHIPRFSGGRARHSQPFDDVADAFATGAVADVLRLTAQINVPYRVDFQVAFHYVILCRQVLFRMHSVFPLQLINH